MNSPTRMRLTPRGNRPQFSENPEVDRLMAMVMALTSEVAVLRERLDTFETLADEKGVVKQVEIENFEPHPDHEEKRQQWRHDFLDRVLYILRAEADEIAERG
jgi:hypothetical protein